MRGAAGESAGDTEMWPAVAVLREIEPRLPPWLVSSHALTRCRQVAARLPDLITSYYMECRLHDDPQVDFLVQFTDREAAAPNFERSLPNRSKSRCWDRNLALMGKWSEGDQPLHEAPVLWLEYDLDPGFETAVPDASPSIGLERGYLSRFIRRRTPDIEAARRRALAGLRAIADGAERASMEADLAHCLAALPPGGSLIYVSVMTARAPSLLKLYLSVPKPAVMAYLAAIGWPGNAAQVERVLASCYGPIAETVFLDVTVESGVLPRIGFALSQLHAVELAAFDPAWTWVDMPGSNPAKRDALQAWPGQSIASIGGLLTSVHRWVDLKAVLDSAGALSFKAYLGFMPALPSPSLTLV
jgi:hypothetical protein